MRAWRFIYSDTWFGNEWLNWIARMFVVFGLFGLLFSWASGVPWWE